MEDPDIHLFSRVRAKSFVRKMPGGTQSHLLEADDGDCYVVKFTNNPQHRRILLNEFLAAVLLDRLLLSSPRIALVEIDSAFLAANPSVEVQSRRRGNQPEVGQHFGSHFRNGHGEVRTQEFSSFGSSPAIDNVQEFAGIFAFDKWTGNQDARQYIYVVSGDNTRVSHAVWIDNGHSFGGPSWKIADSPGFGLCQRRDVYRNIRVWGDFEPWIERIRTLEASAIHGALRQLPYAWFDGNDQNEFGRLVDLILIRRSKVPDLISQTIECFPSAFPNWNRGFTFRQSTPSRRTIECFDGT